MSEETKGTNSSNQSEAKVEESKATAFEALASHISNRESNVDSTESNETSSTDQGKEESSSKEKSEEEKSVATKKGDAVETSEETDEQESSSSSSQSDNDEAEEVSVEDEEENQEIEKSGTEERFAKLEKSYKSLEREFHKRNQLSKSRERELESKDEKIKELETQIRALKGQPDKEPSIIDRIGEKNPEAAKLFAAVKKEAIAEARREFQEELEALKVNTFKSKAEENKKSFSVKLDDFAKKYSGLEDKFMDVIEEFYPDAKQLTSAIAKDDKLFDKIFKEFVFRNRDEVVKLEKGTNKRKEENNSDTDPEKTKQRDAEIQKSKGAGKPKASSKKDSEEDWTDLSDINKFRKAPKDKKLAWAAKHGFGEKDSFSNL